MKQTLLFLMFFPALLFAGHGKQQQALSGDLGLIQGEWQLVSASRDGVTLPEEELLETTIVFSGDTFAFPGASSIGTSQQGTFALDESTSPRQIDSFAPDGTVSLGIYKIEGDTYTVAFAQPGMERPTDFESASLIQIWQRK